jgi:hypothetical protein
MNKHLKLNEALKQGNIPEDPVFGNWYHLSFEIFLKIVQGTKCSQKFFSVKK